MVATTLAVVAAAAAAAAGICCYRDNKEIHDAIWANQFSLVVVGSLAGGALQSYVTIAS